MRRARSNGSGSESTRLIPLAIAAVVFALDRATKLWIEAPCRLWDSFHVIPGFFDIVHTKNKGAAFGMFARKRQSIADADADRRIGRVS